VTELDDKIRGAIEHDIEIQLDTRMLNQDTEWIFDEFPEFSISSKKDFLLGFTIGKLMYLAWTSFTDNNYDATDSDLEVVKEIIRRRIPEIERKIMTELGI
jgi:hypothetical protein